MGALCLKRPINYQYGGMVENSQMNNQSKFQHQANTYLSMGQHQSIRAVQTIDEMMKLATIENHPSMNLQNKIFQAKENNDLQTLIDLMNCNDPTAYQINMGHPWAESPSTIGSISLMYMQILLMRELHYGEADYEKQEEQLQQNIKIIQQNNVIEQLKKNLDHKDQDRVQISVILLVFLVEYSVILQSFYDCDIYSKMLSFMHQDNKNPIGFRISVAFICRELYKDRKDYIQMFLNDKEAMDSIIEFLYSDNILFVIEGLNNIDELCKEDELQKFQSNNCYEILYNYGFINHLQKIQAKLENQKQNINEDLDLELISDRNFTINIIKSLINRIWQNCKTNN